MPLTLRAQQWLAALAVMSAAQTGLMLWPTQSSAAEPARARRPEGQG